MWPNFHGVPTGTAPRNPRNSSCRPNVASSGWHRYLSSRPVTICDGHSTVRCAIPNASASPYFCWIRRAYHTIDAVSGTHDEWHAFCDPVPSIWNGSANEPLLMNGWSKGQNHFAPANVRPYLFLHRVAELPARLHAPWPSDAAEVAYLLNGDSVTRPSFNPWHANADLLNFFIVRRMLAVQLANAAPLHA